MIVKHANPCGAALASGPQDAYQRAYETDPTSAFGGIIAFNRPLDAATAAAILGRQFVEVIVAPVIGPEAQAVLAAKPTAVARNAFPKLGMPSGSNKYCQRHDRSVRLTSMLASESASHPGLASAIS